MSDGSPPTQADKDAVQAILDGLDVNWWQVEKTRDALAQAYALGRQSKNAT